MTLMILKMIGCLALLMFGMKTMSEGLQKLTGDNALNKGSVKAYGYGGELRTYVSGVIGYEQMNSYYQGFDKLGNRGNVYAEGVFRTYVGGVLGWADRPYNLNYALRRSYN